MFPNLNNFCFFLFHVFVGLGWRSSSFDSWFRGIIFLPNPLAKFCRLLDQCAFLWEITIGPLNNLKDASSQLPLVQTAISQMGYQLRHPSLPCRVGWCLLRTLSAALSKASWNCYRAVKFLLVLAAQIQPTPLGRHGFDKGRLEIANNWFLLVSIITPWKVWPWWWSSLERRVLSLISKCCGMAGLSYHY